MKLLGSRLRQRRRQMGLQQKEVALQNSASFLSKVETGAAHPSLATLRGWAATLQTTPTDLLGEDLALEAAKQTILITHKCHAYLDQLPQTCLTDFLRKLSTSATSLSIPVPAPPQNPELHYLTAKVLDHKGLSVQAAELLESSLTRWRSPLWCIYYLSLLCQVYDKLSETAKKKRTEKALQNHIAALDPHKLMATLPNSPSITNDDLDLLRLSILLKPLFCPRPQI